MRGHCGEIDAVNVENDLNGQLESYAEVLSLLEKNLRYIESLGISEARLQDYRKVLSHLRTKSPADIGKILGKKTAKKQKDVEPNLTDEEICQLKGDQIEQHLNAQKITRSFLERLASVRFGVTKGALSMLRSREALTDKIRTLLTHESTHEAISRAASGQADTNPLNGDRS